MKVFAILIILLNMSGCATLRPVPSQTEHIPFREYVTAAMSGEQKNSAELSSVSTALRTYLNATLVELRNRAANSWNVSDVTALGAISAVLGGVADKSGLLNTGLFVAGGGTTVLTSYKLDRQVELYLITVNRLTCVRSRVSTITPEVARLVRVSQEYSAIEALELASGRVIDVVETIQYAHLRSLYTLKATVPTRDELTDYFNRYALARSSAEGSGSSARAANKSEEVIAAIKLILAFHVEVEACSRLQ